MMKTRLLFASAGALIIAAALLLFSRGEKRWGDQWGQQTERAPDSRDKKRRSTLFKPATSASTPEGDDPRSKYKQDLGRKLAEKGLAANLKDTVEKPMAGYVRQDLFIQFITLSLERAGFEKTVDEILAGLEPGAQRDQCIMLAFVNAKDDLSVLHGKLMALEGREERTSAMEGIRSAIEDRDVPLAELLDTFPERSLKELVLMGSAGATGSPFNPTADRGRFIDRNVSDLVDAIRGGTLEKETFDRFVKEAGANARGESSFHLWDSINNVERMEGLNIHPTTYKSLAASMMTVDPARTFSSLAGSEVPLPPDIISESAKNWLNLQNVQPVEWLRTKGGDLDPAFKDSFINGLIDYNLEKGGVDESRQWSDQIQDPDLKRRIQEKIEGARER